MKSRAPSPRPDSGEKYSRMPPPAAALSMRSDSVRAALGLHLHGEEPAARTLAERMLRAAAGGGMREYFSPDSGRGLGARDFTWTAALCLRARART